MLWSLVCAWAVDGQDLAALVEMPGKAQALRDHGLDADQVSSLLQVVQKSALPRKEAVDLIAHAGLLVQEHGPIDDFSKFVDARIQAGERGAVLHGSLTDAHKNKTAAAPAPVAPVPASTPQPAGPAPARPHPGPVAPGTSTKGKGKVRPSSPSPGPSSGAKGKGTTR